MTPEEKKYVESLKENYGDWPVISHLIPIIEKQERMLEMAKSALDKISISDGPLIVDESICANMARETLSELEEMER